MLNDADLNPVAIGFALAFGEAINTETPSMAINTETPSMAINTETPSMASLRYCNFNKIVYL